MRFARLVASVACVLLSHACSSAAAPEPGPAAPTTTSEARSAEPTTPAPSEPGHPLPSETQIQTMIASRVLEHPRVAAFLHTEVAANRPLSVHAVPELAGGLANVQVAGERVRVAADAASARFQFTALERTTGTPRVRVRFVIPAEGASGHVDLELRDYVWEYVGVEVAER